MAGTLDRRALLALGALAAGAALLGACGRKDRIAVPEGQEADYVYPRTYPDPATVVPANARPLSPQAPEPPEPTFGQERTTSTVIE